MCRRRGRTGGSCLDRYGERADLAALGCGDQSRTGTDRGDETGRGNVAMFVALLAHTGGVVTTMPEASSTVAVAWAVWLTGRVTVTGVTETLAIVDFVTTRVALLAIPSTVPVIEAVPPATAVTNPRLDTVATAGLEVSTSRGGQ